MNTSQKIACLDTAIEQIFKQNPDFAEYESTGFNLLQGLHTIKQDILCEMYPIQDDTWPSRRWNAKGEHIDLSGFGLEHLIDEDPFKDIDFVPEA